MSDGFERNVHCLLGLPFDAVDMAGAVARVRNAAMRREPCMISTPNLNWVVACLDDSAFRNSVLESDMSLADGMPLVWVARLLGIPIGERVAGSSLFEHLQHANESRIPVYFFGGMDGVAEAACRRLNATPSGLVCVGHECPGFGSVDEMSSDGTISRINASGAGFVIVSLGARKGQEWIARNRDRISAPVISHLGAVVDFAAGRVSRAPTWTQKLALEWLWRINEDPKLWRRYWSDGLVFLRLLVTRIIPHFWFILLHRPAPRELDGAGIELHDRGAVVEIRLRGAWVKANLQRLREGVSRAALPGKDIRLELAAVTYVDSAFIGLLMLLYGDRRRHRARLSVSGSSARIRRILRYACAEFLLGAGDDRPAGRGAGQGRDSQGIG